MDSSRLYEDGFMDKKRQVKTLYRKGKTKKEISEKLNISLMEVNNIVKNGSGEGHNLNE